MSAAVSDDAPLLVIAPDADRLQALQGALCEAGLAHVQTATRFVLVQADAPGAPRAIVWQVAAGQVDAALGGLATAQGRTPVPLVALLDGTDAHRSADLVCAGAAVATTAGVAREPGALRALLGSAQALHARHEALQSALAEARARLDERKWVDRAKGLLMAARSLDEDQAFQMLRSAAMQANLRLAEVSRAVVDAARRAEAVNRAGQLRMLSQRLVALAAQALARVDAAHARRLRTQALQRLRDNLEHLAAQPLPAAAAGAFERARAEGAALDAALGGRIATDALERADVHAEALLQAADELTRALEADGAQRALAVVNLCGSQRMRVQRLLKDAVLARLHPDPARERRLQAVSAEFEDVQRRLEASPLGSPAFRAALGAAGEGWLLLLRAWRAGDLGALVHAGEALLQELERLTQACEHSLQVLMG